MESARYISYRPSFVSFLDVFNADYSRAINTVNSKVPPFLLIAKEYQAINIPEDEPRYATAHYAAFHDLMKIAAAFYVMDNAENSPDDMGHHEDAEVYYFAAELSNIGMNEHDGKVIEGPLFDPEYHRDQAILFVSNATGETYENEFFFEKGTDGPMVMPKAGHIYFPEFAISFEGDNYYFKDGNGYSYDFSDNGALKTTVRRFIGVLVGMDEIQH